MTASSNIALLLHKLLPTKIARNFDLLTLEIIRALFTTEKMLISPGVMA